MASQEEIDQTREALVSVQAVEPLSLVRSDLGPFNFAESEVDAQRVIDLYRRLNPEKLDIFSTQQLTHIRGRAEATFSVLERIRIFDAAAAGNARDERNGLVNELRSLANNEVEALSAVIAYSVASTLDPKASQQEIREALAASETEVRDTLAKFAVDREAALKAVDALRTEAQETLERVRTAAAEHGVSQQASHFRTEAIDHDQKSGAWLRASISVGIGVLAFAFVSIFTYRVPWIAPTTNIETAQLISGKLIILSVLAYALVICVRNFLSHRHNAVVNKHRQNALLTYTAFVDAAPSTASREIVLSHAAASVFAPQETGYVKSEEPPGAKSILEMITKSQITDKT